MEKRMFINGFNKSTSILIIAWLAYLALFLIVRGDEIFKPQQILVYLLIYIFAFYRSYHQVLTRGDMVVPSTGERFKPKENKVARTIYTSLCTALSLCCLIF